MHNEIVMLFSDIKCFCKYSLQQVHNKLVVIRCPCDLKILSFFVKCNNPGNYAEDYQAFNLGIGKDLGLFGAFSFDITQANTTLADGTRHSGQSVKSVYSKSFYQTGTNIQVAGYRYSTQGFYNLSDSAYSRMSGYTVKPPTGDTNEQTQFIDYFNLFYSKRGQEQISISQQLGNYGTTFFSASRQSYWNTSRSDQQISFGLNVPFGDITTSLNYSYSNNIWQNDRDHLLAFTLNVPFSHWMRTDSQSAFRNSNASYSMSNDLKGGMTNLSGVYGTLLPDNNLNVPEQNNILPYSARLKSTQKSVNPGLVRASATFTLEFQ